jgi:isochorismate hydrolase
MKETYFTAATLEQKARELCQPFEQQRARRLGRFSPAQSALLVLDVQDYFLDSASHAWVPSAAAVLPGIQTLVRAYQARGLPAIFTRHLNTPSDAGQMATWWRELLTADNPLSQVTRLLDTANSPVIQKSQYDAFYATPLAPHLHKLGVSQVVVCGLMTHLCCETTARSAFGRGFDVFFCVDGTATYREDFHRASLLNLAHGFAVLARVNEILAALEEAHG